MRRAAVWLLVVPMFFSCSDDLLGTAAGEVVATPDSIDFGQRFIGTSTSELVTLTNNGRTSVTVSQSSLPAGYQLRPSNLSLVSGGSAEVRVVFDPKEAQRYDGEAGLSLSGAQNAGLTIELKGEGVPQAIEVVPSLDFGLVRVGETKTLSLPLKSLVEFPLDPVSLAVIGSEAEQRASFSPSVTALSIAPGAEASLEVSFTPSSANEHAATLQLGFCEGCPFQQVQLAGRGGRTLITANPPSLAFGTSTPGLEKTLNLVLWNSGQFPAMVSSVEFVDVEEGVPSHADFSVVDGRSFELPVGGNADVTVRFLASEELGPRVGLIQVLDEEGSSYVDVHVSGKSGGIEVVALPSPLEFGKQPLSVVTTRSFVVQNVGQPKTVRLEQPRVGAGFTVRAADESLSPWTLSEDGVPLTFEVSFSSATEGEFFAEISFPISEPDAGGHGWTPSTEQPALELPVSGRAAIMPPCELDIRPPTVRFGAVRAGRSHARDLEIANVGTDECFLSNMELQVPGVGRPVFSLPVEPPEGGFVLAAGESFKTTIRYAPVRAQNKTDETYFVFHHSSADTEPERILVTGLAAGFELVANPNPLSMGTVKQHLRQYEDFDLVNRGSSPVQINSIVTAAGPASSLFGVATEGLPMPLIAASGAAQFKAWFLPIEVGPVSTQLEVFAGDLLEPFLIDIRGIGSTEVCDEECRAPTATCLPPQPQPLRVNTQATLHGIGESPGGHDIECEWRVIEAPRGSREQPGPGCNPTFTPDMVGEYVFELIVRETNDADKWSSCQVTLEAEPWGGLWVEMFWDRNRDIDLHVVNDALGDPYVGSTWFASPSDCYFGNKNPTWDAGGNESPSLDRDDIPGTGPENIRVSSPVSTHGYVVGFHNWNNPNVPVEVTTNIYCGGSLISNSSTISTAVGQVFILGTVNYNNGTCTFTPEPNADQPFWHSRP